MSINLRNFDLNLLLIFDALMTERNVTRAAKKVFLSQPAMSHALNRLRTLLDDPVLVKTEAGLVPTPKALSLEQPFRDAINRIQQSLMNVDEFDPITASINYSILSVEHFEILLFPELLERLASIAPRIGLHSDVLGAEIPEAELANGEVSVVIALDGYHRIGERLNSMPLLVDHFVYVARKENKKVGKSITIKQLQGIGHVDYKEMPTTGSFVPTHPFSLIDQWHRSLEFKPRITFSANSYFTAARAVAMTDNIMALPFSQAMIMQKALNLRIVDPPQGAPAFKLNMVWHRLYDDIAANRWLREQLLETAQKLRE